MIIDDIVIDADLSDILKTLRTELATKNINVFSVTKPAGDNIQTICPFHKHGQERKPSFGINVNTGACNCFTCGWKGYLPYLIECLYGRYDNDFGKNWLIRNFNSISVSSRPGIKLPNRNVKLDTTIKCVPESELEQYRYTHKYLYDRGLSNYIIDKFDVGYDKNTDCITFPVKDLDGNVVFVARRSVKSKFFNYPTGVDKPVYGAYLFKDGKYKECYITESFFNCLTLWKFGLPSVALMGTGTKTQYEILNKLPVREYILALDPDTAGQNGTKKLRDTLCSNHLIKEIQYIDDKDINELQEEFLNLKKIW